MGDRPDTGRESHRAWRAWSDVFRGYPLALVILCMAAVVGVDAAWLAEAAPVDVAALVNGVAAVVAAVAALIEARRGSANRDAIADHEARLRVLEDRGTRG